MAGSRTLKLSILGDVDNLNKSLKSATADVETFGDKMGKVGKGIGAAFVAAAGAYAVKIGIEGVKAAIADEKAQTQLALALQNATGATNAQIAATEQSILKMSLATGVADDDLRPALGRLVRSTGDTEKAQQLLAQALDISAATGKPLETVSAALAKGFDGNTAALGKLGIGLSSAELKSMSFEQVQSKLSDLFGGAAAANADTYAGKIARVQVAFDEAKETLGTALLPIVEKFIGFINDNALPLINSFASAFSGTAAGGLGKTLSDIGNTIKNTVQPIFEGFKTAVGFIKDAIIASKDEFSAFGDVIKFIAPLIGSAIGAAIGVIGPIASAVITVIGKVLAAIKPVLNFAIDGVNAVIAGINLIKTGEDIPKLKKIGDTPGVAGFSGTMPNGQSFSTSSSTKITMPEIPTGVVTASKSGSTAAAASLSLASNKNAGNYASSGFPGADINAPNITVNVSGAIDKEGTARTIVETLNNSFYRGTGGAGALVSS
jgi:phage-related protein